MARRPRSIAVLSVDALGTALGPRVRLTIEGTPILMTTVEAQRVAQWLWDAAALADLDDIDCHHCHGDPPEGHTCPACGRRNKR